MATPQSDQQIREHEEYLQQLNDLASQVNAVEPTQFQKINPRAQRQFLADRSAKLLEIRSAAGKAERNLSELRRASNKPDPNAPKPLTEAQSLAADARDQKRLDDIATQKQQKDLAASKLEQQKAADAASVPALGAGGNSLKDLLTNFAIKKNPDDDSYTFSQPNTTGVLTPGQKRSATQLAAALKSSGMQPEEIFGAGVPAPQFDAKGNSIPSPGGNPYIGTKAQFSALANLYQGAQPSESTDLVVPSGTLNRVYQATAPAYGGTFPGNPVAEDTAGLAADTFTHSPDRLNFESQMNTGRITPSAPTEFGPQPPTLDDRKDAATAKIGSISASTGVAPGKVASIFAATQDPKVQQAAIEQEQSDAARAKLPEQLGTLGISALKYATTPGITASAPAKAADILRDYYGNPDATMADEDFQNKVRAARSMPPTIPYEDVPEAGYLPSGA